MKRSRTGKRNPKVVKTSNVGRRFVMFVKTYDEYGYLDEDRCGWFNFRGYKDSTLLPALYGDAQVFVEGEPGHGSFEDWKRFLEEERPGWRINSPPKYLD